MKFNILVTSVALAMVAVSCSKKSDNSGSPAPQNLEPASVGAKIKFNGNLVSREVILSDSKFSLTRTYTVTLKEDSILAIDALTLMKVGECKNFFGPVALLSKGDEIFPLSESTTLKKVAPKGDYTLTLMFGSETTCAVDGSLQLENSDVSNLNAEDDKPAVL